jgi:hypothetical protein
MIIWVKWCQERTEKTRVSAISKKRVEKARRNVER